MAKARKNGPAVFFIGFRPCPSYLHAMGTYRYVFGPVPSRRLGNSLGVDLIPSKTCTFNCVYCQIGKPSKYRLRRGSFVPAEAVYREIKAACSGKAHVDFVTFSGSGEPTLNKDLGRLIRRVKGNLRKKVAVITNGSLLWRKAVRKDLAAADIVLPSLDFGSAAAFNKMNRAVPGLTAERIISGLVAFRKEFKGTLWLEVFLADGINTDRAELTAIKKQVARIRPDRIHLNTAVRPPLEHYIKAVDRTRMEKIQKLFGPQAEVAASYTAAKRKAQVRTSQTEIMNMLRRRPLSLKDLAQLTGQDRAVLKALLAEMAQKKVIRSYRQAGKTYYMPV